MYTKEDLKWMDRKEDLKGMDRKEDMQDLKELMKDIKHRFSLCVSTQKEDLFHSVLEKI